MICAANVMAGQNAAGINIELVLSIVAIVISLVTMAFEFWGNQRINRINLEAKFYEEIYNDFLINKLPEARNKMVYNNNRISETDTLTDVLNDIRRASLFFKYRDEEFYDELCKALQDLENEIVNKSDKTLDSDEYCKFTQYVKEQIECIYTIIIEKYTGKIRFKKKAR